MVNPLEFSFAIFALIFKASVVFCLTAVVAYKISLKIDNKETMEKNDG